MADPTSGTGHPPVYRPGLRHQRLQGVPGRALRHQPDRRRRGVLDRDRDAGPVRSRVRNLGGRGRTEARHGDLGAVLVERVPRRLCRNRHRAAVAALPRVRRHRRHRPGHRLHQPGLDADQVVPRPPRAGHRARHHGIRRRGDDRQSLVVRASGHLRPVFRFLLGHRRRQRQRGREAVRDPRPGLPRRHAVRRLACPRAARGLASRGLRPDQGEGQDPRHHRERLGQGRREDPAVLAPVDGAVLQRHSGHRDPGAGGADDPGLLPLPRRRLERGAGGGCRVRRTAVDDEHGRAVRVVQHLRLHRPQSASTSATSASG